MTGVQTCALPIWKKKIVFAAALAGMLVSGFLSGCGSETENNDFGKESIELIWYQVGDYQKDDPAVMEKANQYIEEKIGVTLRVIKAGWADYNQKMQVVFNTDEAWDLCFTCSWTNDYLQNAQKGVFLELDELLPEQGAEMYGQIDDYFWEAAKVGGRIYGVPNEKEIGSCPMWVFTRAGY